MIPEIVIAAFTVFCGAVSLHYARRARQSARFVADQLAPAGVDVSPRCGKCRGPLQAATRPHNGQTHFCPTCELWAVVVAVPGPRGGDR